MTRFNRYFLGNGQRRAWLAGAIAVLASAAVAVGLRVFGPSAPGTAGPASRQAPPYTDGHPGSVVTSVNAQAILARWKMTPSRPGLEVDGVGYAFGREPAAPISDMWIAVFASATAAHDRFARALWETTVGPYPLQGDLPGDEFRCWSPGANGPNVRLRLRRDNVLIGAGWRGSVAQAVAFAREVDKMLLDEKVAPRAAKVSLPVVEITLPRVAVAGETAELTYRVPDGTRVWLQGRGQYRLGDDPKPQHLSLYGGGGELAAQGFTQMTLLEPGRYTLELSFATEGHALFQQTCRLEVIARNQVPPTLPRAREIPGDTVYLLRSPEARWEKVPADEREWVQWDRGTFGWVDDVRRSRQQALDDLTQVIQPKWLPLPALLEPGLDHEHPSPPPVCHSSYKVNGCHVVYMGVIGRQFLLYLEQPHPLPKGQKLLTVRDVLRDDVIQAAARAGGKSAYPRAAFMAKRWRRYRAYQPEGPYEQVNILLIEVRLSEGLDLRFPGYR